MDPPSAFPPPPPPQGPPPRSISSSSGYRRKSSSPITALLSERSGPTPVSPPPAPPPPPPSSKSRQSHLSGRPPSPSIRSPPGISLDETASLKFSNRRQTTANRIVEERRRAAQAMLESSALVEDAIGKEDVISQATFRHAQVLPSQRGDRENESPNASTNWDADTDHSKSSDGQTTSTRSSARQQPRPHGSRSRERQRPEPSPGRSGSTDRSIRLQNTGKERRQATEPPAPTPPPSKQKKGKSEEVEKKKGGLFGIFGRGREKPATQKESKEKQLKQQQPTSSQPSVTRKPSTPVQPLSKSHPSPIADSSRSQLSPPAKLVVSTSPSHAVAPATQLSPTSSSPVTSKGHLKSPPKNLKPGQSYKSSPNSAEIVVRTSLIQTPSRPEPPASGRLLRSPINTRSPREKQNRTPTLFSFSGRQDPDGTKDPPIGHSFSLAEDPPESPSTMGLVPSTSMDSYAHPQLEAPPSFTLDFVPHKQGRDPSLASMAERTMRDSESGFLVMSTTSASQDGSTGDVMVHRLGQLVSDTTFSGSQHSSQGRSSRSRHAGEFSASSPMAGIHVRHGVDNKMLAERPMPEPADSMELEDDDDFMDLPAPPSNIGTLSYESQAPPDHVSRREELSALRVVSMLDSNDSLSSSTSSPRSSSMVQPIEPLEPSHRQISHRMLDPSSPVSQLLHLPAQSKDSDPQSQPLKPSASPPTPKELSSAPHQNVFGAHDGSRFLGSITASQQPSPVAVHLEAFAEIIVAPDDISAITDPSYRKRDQNTELPDEVVDGLNDDVDTLVHTKDTDHMTAASDNPVVARSEVSGHYVQNLVANSPSNIAIGPFTEAFLNVPRLPVTRKPDPSDDLENEDDILEKLEMALTRTDTDRGTSVAVSVERPSHIESGYISAASTEEEEKKIEDEILTGFQRKSDDPMPSVNEHVRIPRHSVNQVRPPALEIVPSPSNEGVRATLNAIETSEKEKRTVEPPTPQSYISAQQHDPPVHNDLALAAQPSPTAATIVDHKAMYPGREHVNRLSLNVGTPPASMNRPKPPPSPEAPESSVLKARQYFLGLERNIKTVTNANNSNSPAVSLYSKTTQKLTSQSMSPRQRRRAKAASPKRPTSLDAESLRPDTNQDEIVSEQHQDLQKRQTKSFSPKQKALKTLMDPIPKRRPMFASLSYKQNTDVRNQEMGKASTVHESSLESSVTPSSEVADEESLLNSTATTSYLAKLRGGRKARLALRTSRPEKFERQDLRKTSDTSLARNIKHDDKAPARNRLGLLEEAKKNPAAVRSKKAHKEKSKEAISGMTPHITITTRHPNTDVVARGISIKSTKRKTAIAQGKATPVVLKPKPKVERSDVVTTSPSIDKLIKDPIQRAGFRLLSKAAIPIQATVRRYLAQREAVDRMWALIEIQSYFRRWKCEAFKLAHTYSATRIQAAFRGWRDRDTLEDQHFCSTQIQRVIRGYLVFAFVREILSRIPLVQAQIRGFLAKRIAADRMYAIILIQSVVRSHLSRIYVIRMRASTVIQRIARGILARKEAMERRAAATIIQAAWRSFSTRLMFQLDFVDIITVQSIIRRWLACKRKYELGRELQRSAAVKIQAAWRGYHDYTTYIFAMADIIVVQRVLRMWQAKMKVKSMRRQMEAQVLNTRRDISATTIQSFWRRYIAQSDFVSQLVNIIMIQSMARRYLARKLRNYVADWKIARIQSACLVQKWRRMTLFRRSLNIHRAATKIQTLWRGFWQYTYYIIVQYEIVRVQALLRGNLARNYFSMRLGCAIIIQATGRQFLAKKRVRSMRTSKVLVQGASLAIRESIACKKIQCRWRHQRRSRVEKAAGLVIERFFLMVKEEVDREIRRREKRRTSKNKREKKRRHKKEPEEKALERAWLNTVDENKVDDFEYPMNSDSKSMGAESRSKSAPRLRNTFSTESGVSFHPSVVSQGKASTSLRNCASSPRRKHVTLHEEAKEIPSQGLVNQRSSDDSDISGLTNPTYRLSYLPRQTALTQKELSDDLSLEEAFLDVQAHHTKQKRKTVDDYIQKYGLQKSMTIKSQASAHTRVSIDSRFTSISRASAASRRFFPDEVETPRSTHPALSPTNDDSSPQSAGSAGVGLTKNPRLRIMEASTLSVGTERNHDKYTSSLYASSSSVSSSDAGINSFAEPLKSPLGTGNLDKAGPHYLRKSTPMKGLDLHSSTSSPREDLFYRMGSA